MLSTLDTKTAIDKAKDSAVKEFNCATKVIILIECRVRREFGKPLTPTRRLPCPEQKQKPNEGPRA